MTMTIIKKTFRYLKAKRNARLEKKRKRKQEKQQLDRIRQMLEKQRKQRRAKYRSRKNQEKRPSPLWSPKLEPLEKGVDAVGYAAIRNKATNRNSHSHSHSHSLPQEKILDITLY